jgi:outer membrane lipoprotein-sorting protein
MWRRCGGLAALGLVWMCATAARSAEPKPEPAKPSGPPTWFAETLSYTETGLGVTYFWSKGAKLRAETVIAGRRVTTIVSGNTYYAYDAVGQNGIAIARSEKAMALDARGERPFGREFANLVSQGAEPVRDEEVMGRACEVFRLTDELGRREIWVTKDKLRLPIRAVVYRRDTGNTVTTDFINWLTGLVISDGFFEPSSSVKLDRMDLSTYLQLSSSGAAIGPVPVLYTDLLLGR